MTLGERCDEIVRLIDATLADCTPVTDQAAGEVEATVVEVPSAARAHPTKAPRQHLPRSA